MKIITVPHPTLRKKAQPIKTVDKRLIRLVDELQATLSATRNPQGVGLAAPQIDKLERMFAASLPEIGGMNVYINPVVTAHSKELTFGPDEKDPYLEGCLSIPFIYGPVPRFEWIELEFAVIEDEQLVTYGQRFGDFAARVMQHELDHLDGILFTDYSLQYDLPIYQGKSRSSKMEEVDKSILNFV